MIFKQLFTSRNTLLLALLAAAFLFPAVLGGNQYQILLATNVLLYAVLATAWNIIGGMGGQFDLSAAAYMGIGSFTAGTLLLRWNVSPWLSMPLGGLLAVGLSLVVGLPLFRFKVKEVWYGLSSAALVEVLRIAFTMWEEVGGPTERMLPYHQSSLYYMRFSSYIPYFYILLVMLILVLAVNVRIRRSKLGYSLLALSEDEDAAEVLGVDARFTKIRALMIYAFICGAVGTVDVCIKGNLAPKVFNFAQSTDIAIIGVVGGMGITFGPMMAAILLVGARELLRAKLGGGIEGLYMVFYAVVLILVALFSPRGIAALIQDAYRRLKAHYHEGRNGKTANA